MSIEKLVVGSCSDSHGVFSGVDTALAIGTKLHIGPETELDLCQLNVQD